MLSKSRYLTGVLTGLLAGLGLDPLISNAGISFSKSSSDDRGWGGAGLVAFLRVLLRGPEERRFLAGLGLLSEDSKLSIGSSISSDSSWLSSLGCQSSSFFLAPD